MTNVQTKISETQDGVESRKENLNTPGSIESYGAALISSILILILFSCGSLFLLWALGANKESAANIFNSIMKESYGVYSFVSASFISIIGNSIFLIVNMPDKVNFVNIWRLRVQNIIVGFFGVVFAVGYFGMGNSGFHDLQWTLIISSLVMIITALTNYLKKNNLKCNNLVACLYIVVLIVIVIFAMDIFELLKISW
ncbi:EamA-like transporter family [Moritella viscosa]|uniref:hypothetical protein n=1 Tax=Moritella viscosa TaxID=80854 RepID=UPI00050906DD|nr:hypothetical protein [Moritella viscosa]CED59948.1 putative uncharacterized phage membrane protein [Moritella viscosa]SHO03105.1 EamA-like transporter family [Moritella viscosa]SHO03199.1 EamA-like transporter family [Moritella viscosa]SHO03983.1 EamA-like transporter family [Moritella viscosa]SHO08537.1 EamA-like transporter family [Moritella viscosa]